MGLTGKVVRSSGGVIGPDHVGSNHCPVKLCHGVESLHGSHGLNGLHGSNGLNRGDLHRIPIENSIGVHTNDLVTQLA